MWFLDFSIVAAVKVVGLFKFPVLTLGCNGRDDGCGVETVRVTDKLFAF